MSHLFHKFFSVLEFVIFVILFRASLSTVVMDDSNVVTFKEPCNQSSRYISEDEISEICSEDNVNIPSCSAGDGDGISNKIDKCISDLDCRIENKSF